MSPLWAGQRAFGEAGVPAGEAVVVLRRPMVTRPGSGVQTLGSWKDATERDVDGVGLDRSTSVEMNGTQGDSFTQLAMLYGPTGADIQNGDRVLFGSGLLVEVVGIPDRSRHMLTGWRPPMSVQVRVTHG